MAITIEDVKRKALLVFGDSKLAGEWLNSPLPVLKGRTPLSVINDEGGIRRVEMILFKIEAGDFS